MEPPKHFQHGVLVGEEDVSPHGRIGSRNAGEIAKASGGELQDFRARDLAQLIRSADNGIGNEMRQVARDAEHQVVVLGRHLLHVGAEQTPECCQPFHRGRVGARRRSENAPAVDE